MPMLLGYNNYVLPEADMWHPAVFKGIEKTDSKFGPRYKWKFELISDDEELDGNPIHGNTSQSISEKSHAGKFFFLPMTEMTDEEASELGDEKIDFDWGLGSPDPSLKAALSPSMPGGSAGGPCRIHMQYLQGIMTYILAIVTDMNDIGV